MLIPKFRKSPKTDSDRSQRSALPSLSMLLTLSKLFVFEKLPSSKPPSDD